MGDWLGTGFDADAEMLALINSGQLSGLADRAAICTTLKDKFQGPVVADLLCYLRLHTELALRAKGMLMMRENGFDVPVDEATREKFAELRYLEKSIGPHRPPRAAADAAHEPQGPVAAHGARGLISDFHFAVDLGDSSSASQAFAGGRDVARRSARAVVAPAMTLATVGREASQPKASSSSVRPRCSANAASASTTSTSCAR